MSGVVYYAHAPRIEVVKIGFTVRPIPVRLKELVKQFRCSLHVLGTIAGQSSLEEIEQARWAHLWLSREWFIETKEILEYAQGLCGTTSSFEYVGDDAPARPEVVIRSVYRKSWHPETLPNWWRVEPQGSA